MDFRSLDSFLLDGSVRRNYACSYSSDSRFFIVAEGGIYVVELKPDLNSRFQTLCCRKDFITPSNFTISDKVGIDLNKFIYSLPKEQLYVGVLRSELSAALNSADPIEPSALYAQWSSKGLVRKSECALACLSSTHNLEIYVKNLDHSGIMKYRLLANLTEYILDQKKQFWKEAKFLGVQNSYAEFVRRLENVTPTAFCWGHIFRQADIDYTVIFVGHFDGSITAWKIPEIAYNCDNLDCIFLGAYSTKLGQISSLYWHRTSEFGGGLCIGSISGKISILQIKNLHQPEAYLGNEVEFWSQNDACVDKLLVTIIDHFTVLIAAKQSNILIFALDHVGKVFDFVVYDVKNFYITGLECEEDTLFVQTLNGLFKKLKIEIKLQNLKINESIIPLKVDPARYRFHGFVFSPNRMFMGVLCYPKHGRKLVKVQGKILFEFFHNADIKPFEILWGAPENNFANYWDCLEVLRMLCLKEKRFPWLGLSQNLNYDTLSLKNLKLLRHVAKISENVYSSINRVVNYNIKPYILIHYMVMIKLTVQRMSNWLKIRENGSQLTEFQLQSMFLQNMFLKEVVLSGILAKANVARCFIDEISAVMEICNELEYPEMPVCCICGERILGLACLPPHADSRCCISMMPIFVVPALQCPLCSSMIHHEMLKEIESILCPYCDVPMDHVSVGPDYVKILEKNMLILNVNGGVNSACFHDCARDKIDVDSLEENQIQYTIFSDSDSENDQGSQD